MTSKLLMLVTSASALLGACSWSAAQDAATAERDIQAVLTSSAPVIDGDLSDACWSEAARADGFTDAFLGSRVQDQTAA